MSAIRLSVLLHALLALSPVLATTAEDSMLVFIGTYADAKNPGIHVLRLDPASGSLTPVSSVSGLTNPSFVAVHPNHKFLYAVCEGGKGGGSVSSLSLDPATGALAVLNQQSAEGGGPCHVSTDRAGTYAMVANYGSGSIAVLPINADGTLKPASAKVQHVGTSVNKNRQEGPHAHGIGLDPSEKFLLCSDLGLDKVLVYKFDAKQGAIVPNDPSAGILPPGSGPRHYAFSPNGKFVYVLNELLSTLTTMTWDGAKGALTEVATVPTLPAGFTGNNSTAEVVVSADGRFVYASNRGHNSIAVFAIDAASGKTSLVGHVPSGGKTPRCFTIDPTGGWLLAAHQDSDSVVMFRLDKTTGLPAPTGVSVTVPKAVCVVVMPH